MLNRLWIIILSCAFSTLLAAADFYSFTIINFAFVMHNVLALAVGLFLVCLGVLMLRKKDEKMFYLQIVLGVGMSVLHLVKLIIGVCV